MAMVNGSCIKSNWGERKAVITNTAGDFSKLACELFTDSQLRSHTFKNISKDPAFATLVATSKEAAQANDSKGNQTGAAAASASGGASSSSAAAAAGSTSETPGSGVKRRKLAKSFSEVSVPEAMKEKKEKKDK